MSLSHKPVYAFDEDGNSKVIQNKGWEISLGEVFLEEQKIFRPNESVANAEPTKVFIRELLAKAEQRGERNGYLKGQREARAHYYDRVRGEGIQQGKREACVLIKATLDDIIAEMDKRESVVTSRTMVFYSLKKLIASLENSSKEE